VSMILDRIRQAARDLLSGDPDRVDRARASLGAALRAVAAEAPSPQRARELAEAAIWARALAATARRGAKIAEAERVAVTGGRTGPAAILNGRA